MVKGVEVLTPPLDGSILPGVALSRVLKLLNNGRDYAVPVQLLSGADYEVGHKALPGVTVAAIDQQHYDLNRNPVTKSLMEAYRKPQLQSVSEVMLCA